MMNFKITVMCWIKGHQTAYETVELNEAQLLDVLRGKSPPVFRTPTEKQHHWELRKIVFNDGA